MKGNGSRNTPPRSKTGSGRMLSPRRDRESTAKAEPRTRVKGGSKGGGGGGGTRVTISLGPPNAKCVDETFNFPCTRLGNGKPMLSLLQQKIGAFLQCRDESMTPGERERAPAAGGGGGSSSRSCDDCCPRMPHNLLESSASACQDAADALYKGAEHARPACQSLARSADAAWAHAKVAAHRLGTESAMNKNVASASAAAASAASDWGCPDDKLVNSMSKEFERIICPGERATAAVTRSNPPNQPAAATSTTSAPVPDVGNDSESNKDESIIKQFQRCFSRDEDEGMDGNTPNQDLLTAPKQQHLPPTAGESTAEKSPSRTNDNLSSLPYYCHSKVNRIDEAEMAMEEAVELTLETSPPPTLQARSPTPPEMELAQAGATSSGTSLSPSPTPSKTSSRETVPMVLETSPSTSRHPPPPKPESRQPADKTFHTSTLPPPPPPPPRSMSPRDINGLPPSPNESVSSLFDSDSTSTHESEQQPLRNEKDAEICETNHDKEENIPKICMNGIDGNNNTKEGHVTPMQLTFGSPHEEGRVDEETNFMQPSLFDADSVDGDSEYVESECNPFPSSDANEDNYIMNEMTTTRTKQHFTSSLFDENGPSTHCDESSLIDAASTVSSESEVECDDNDVGTESPGLTVSNGEDDDGRSCTQSPPTLPEVDVASVSDEAINTCKNQQQSPPLNCSSGVGVAGAEETEQRHSPAQSSDEMTNVEESETCKEIHSVPVDFTKQPEGGSEEPECRSHASSQKSVEVKENRTCEVEERPATTSFDSGPAVAVVKSSERGSDASEQDRHRYDESNQERGACKEQKSSTWVSLDKRQSKGETLDELENRDLQPAKSSDGSTEIDLWTDPGNEAMENSTLGRASPDEDDDDTVGQVFLEEGDVFDSMLEDPETIKVQMNFLTKESSSNDQGKSTGGEDSASNSGIGMSPSPATDLQRDAAFGNVLPPLAPSTTTDVSGQTSISPDLEVAEEKTTTSKRDEPSWPELPPIVPIAVADRISSTRSARTRVRLTPESPRARIRSHSQPVISESPPRRSNYGQRGRGTVKELVSDSERTRARSFDPKRRRFFGDDVMDDEFSSVSSSFSSSISVRRESSSIAFPIENATKKDTKRNDDPSQHGTVAVTEELGSILKQLRDARSKLVSHRFGKGDFEADLSNQIEMAQLIESLASAAAVAVHKH